jgi:hypothetical protein
MKSSNTNNQSARSKTTGRKKFIIAGIVAIAIALFCVFGLKIFSPKPVVQVMKSYGNMNHEVTYDKNNITDEEVDYLADGLTRANFFDNAVTKYIYIKKIKDTVNFSISANPLITSNPPAMQAFVDLRKNMQKQFPKNKIVIDLVVFNFKNVIKRIE